MPVLEPVFLLALGVAVLVVVAIVLSVRQASRTKLAWQAAAETLGLTWNPGGAFRRPLMQGRFEGSGVVVDQYVVSSGKHSTRYTRYTVGYPSLGLGLKIGRESFGGKIGKFFGGQDIKVNSGEFDALYRIRGTDPRAVRAFLTGTRRLRIHRVLAAYPGCAIDDDSIDYRKRGFEPDAQRIVSTVRKLCQLASSLTAIGEEQYPLERAVTAQREGRSDEALEALSEVSAPELSPDADVEALKGDILLVGGRYGEAQAAFETALAVEPGDPELAGLAATARRKVESPPAVESEPVPPSSPTVDVDLDARAVATMLFDSSAMSHEVHALFDERFAGRRVRWSGEIDRVETYRSDMVFGSGPGLKVVVQLLDLEGGFGRDVRAVIALPGEEDRTPWDARGETVELEGTLVRCDPFLRMLFLADGRRASGPRGQ